VHAETVAARDRPVLTASTSLDGLRRRWAVAMLLWKLGCHERLLTP
jgi:hypothetical protein